MAFINWNEDLSVNINSIDDQHKKLFGLINDFYENIKNRTGHENISKLVAGMREYTVEHFNAEEQVMRQFDYPDYLAHKKEHDSFIAKVTDLEEKFNAGKLLVSFEVTNFLKEWLNNHIKEVDKKYSAFFAKKGIV